MNEEQNRYDEIDIREIIHLLRVGWRVVALFFAIAVAVAALVSFYVLEPIYKAESTLFVGKESGSPIAGIDLGQFSLEQKLVADYREIIQSRLVAQEVLEALDLDMDIEVFQNKISVTTVSDSRLFRIGFESPNPELARDVTNTISDVIIIKAQEIMEVKNVQIIDRAELPDRPIKPNKALNLAIAGLLGLMVGVFVLLLMEYLNHTIKSARDVERYLGLAILGEIPVFEGEERGRRNGSHK